MKRIPRTEMWPSLEYRVSKLAYAKRVEEHQEFKKKSEDELVAHLQICPDCRKRIANLVRSGVTLSDRVLAAAKVDVLN